MQSAEERRRTRGRQEGREAGEEGGIVASGDPTLQECADGRVPHSQGGRMLSQELRGGDTCLTLLQTADEIL